MSLPCVFIVSIYTLLALISSPVFARGLAIELAGGSAVSRDAATRLNDYFIDTDTLAQAQANKNRGAWQALLRYDFSTQLQVRAGYVELGPLDTSLVGETNAINTYLRTDPELPLNSVSGWVLSTAYQYTFNKVTNLRAKIGLYRWEASYSLKGGDIYLQRKNTGTHPVLGFDLGIKLSSHLTSRFGWEVYNIDGYKTDLLFIGIELH